MRIAGVIASSISGHLGAFNFIASATNTGSSTISFTSIPGTYKVLQIRGNIVGSSATYLQSWNMTINSDTGANYSYHYLNGDNTNVTAGGGASNANTLSGLKVAGSSLSSSTSSGLIIDIIDYANTNKYKTLKSISGAATNTSTAGNDAITISSGVWMSNSAITSVQLIISGTYATGSTFSMYGIN